MRFTELNRNYGVNNRSYRNKKPINTIGELGALSFNVGPTDKNNERTPHYEMRKSIEMYNINGIVSGGVDQLTLFVIPNLKIKIETKHEQSQVFLEKWCEQRSVLEEIKKWYVSKILTGNPIIEKRYNKTNSGKPVLDNVFNINDTSRVYVNLENKGEDDRFIYEVPVGLRSFEYRGRVVTPSRYRISYFYNNNLFQREIYGFPLNEKEIYHHMSGWSVDDIYGRSPLMSALDDHNLMTEIMSSWDTISKTRQLDRKIISVADKETGMSIDNSRMREIADELSDAKNSFTLLNFPIQMSQTDLNVSRGYDTLDNVYDISRRKLMFSLVPNYLTPWNDSVTTMGAEVSMVPFLQKILSEQHELQRVWSEVIVGELCKTYDWLDEEARIVLDTPRLLPNDTYLREVEIMLRNEIINVESARVILNSVGIIDDEVFELLEEHDAKGDPQLDGLADDSTLVVPPTPGVRRTTDSSDSVYPTEKFVVEQEGDVDELNKWLYKARRTPSLKLFDLKNGEQLFFKNLDGRLIRLLRTGNVFLLFDGLNVVETINDREGLKKNDLKKRFEDYVSEVKALQKVLFKDGNPEEEIILDYEKSLNDDLNKLLQDISSLLGQKNMSESFTEKGLSLKIFPRLDNMFSVFNKRLSDRLNNVMKRLNVSVVNNENDGVELLTGDKSLDSSQVKNLLSKSDLLRQNLDDQLKNTTNKLSADIKTIIRDGISSGLSKKDIRSRVNNEFRWSDKAEKRFDVVYKGLARNASVKLKLLKWQGLGFTHFEWRTMEDDLVRPGHVIKNRKVYSINDALKNDDMSAYPGKDYGCRCFAVVAY